MATYRMVNRGPNLRGVAPCSVDECTGKVHTVGLCSRHAYRFYKYGDINAGGPERIFGDDEARFWSKVDKPSPYSCWEWIGTLDQYGYGEFKVNGKGQRAHRWLWLHTYGPQSADGLDLDHLCRNPSCVNPYHLEAVTHAENVRRGEAVKRKKAKAEASTHCKNGHEWTEANIYVHPQRGRRHCKQCARERARGVR